MASKVYFIKPIGMDGPVKIGCSHSPTGRLCALATWSPFALELVAQIDGEFNIERRFHALFADSHVRREWFDWTQELGDVIDAIKAGTFDIGTLPEPVHIISRNKVRDNLYLTERWRIIRSIFARSQALQRRGLPWKDAHPLHLLMSFREDIPQDEFDEKCADAEAMLEEFNTRFPPKCGRIRKATGALSQAAHTGPTDAGSPFRDAASRLKAHPEWQAGGRL